MADDIPDQRRIGLRARRLLSSSQRTAASAAACRRLARSAVFRRARHIGLYRPLASEADPCGLQALATSNTWFYWPIVRGRRLSFVRHTADARFAMSALGVREPVTGRACSAAALDLIVVPLAAFDHAAGRIGLGGGYYDRTLAHAGTSSGHRRPRLVGFAFDAQRVDAIARQPWDVAMNWIITEAGVYRPGRHRG